MNSLANKKSTRFKVKTITSMWGHQLSTKNFELVQQRYVLDVWDRLVLLPTRERHPFYKAGVQM